MILNFFDRLAFEVIKEMFQKLFRAGNVFFNFRVLVKFVKYLFKVCDIFWQSLMIPLFLWRMNVFALLLLLGKKGLTEFLK